MYLEISLGEEPDTLDEIFHTQIKRVNLVHEAPGIAESGKWLMYAALLLQAERLFSVTQTRDLQVP